MWTKNHSSSSSSSSRGSLGLSPWNNQQVHMQRLKTKFFPTKDPSLYHKCIVVAIGVKLKSIMGIFHAIPTY